MNYDIGEAFKAIEKELTESMIRNLDHHRAQEENEGIQWSQWQAEQLKALEDYRSRNKNKFGEQFQDINNQVDALIYLARQQGGMDQEEKILKAIKNGYKAKRETKNSETLGEFFKANDRKLNALVEATQNDFTKAEHAMLRMANDKYRKIIYNAQVYANVGGTTYEKAVDMATRDFLNAGINCIEYKNGARHTISDYADMCIKTATKRAYLTGEGEKRKEWGIDLVIMNKRGNPCPKCLPYVGKIMIDDVWSGGKADGKHTMISEAISKGLYHPRCKDSHTTYFPGISTAPDPATKEDEEEAVENYNQEQKELYAKKQAEKQQRIADNSLDKDNKRIHQARANEWNEKEDIITETSIDELESQFKEMTDGYAYDDFVKDFGTIESGFEGSSNEEIAKARDIADKIKLLKNRIGGKKLKESRIVRTKQESIELMKDIGTDFIDISSDPISAETTEKLVDFIRNFEIEHPGYFVNNKLKLSSMSICDNCSKTKWGKLIEIGKYQNDGKKNSIQITRRVIRNERYGSWSMSDDNELHILAHEYGHYIADTLKSNFGEYSECNQYNIIRNTIDRMYDGDIFKSVKDLSECLSPYGSTSAGEAFAEAFAEAYTCEKPRTFARLFKEELEKVLKNETVAKSAESDIIKLGNKEVRMQYVSNVLKIKDEIDASLPIEEKAKQAFEARNKIRTEARKIMLDEETRKKLELEHPNKSFDDLVKSKMDRKGMTKEEAIRDIYETSTKTNPDVNRELGIGGD